VKAKPVKPTKSTKAVSKKPAAQVAKATHTKATAKPAAKVASKKPALKAKPLVKSVGKPAVKAKPVKPLTAVKVKAKTPAKSANKPTAKAKPVAKSAKAAKPAGKTLLSKKPMAASKPVKVLAQGASKAKAPVKTTAKTAAAKKVKPVVKKVSAPSVKTKPQAVAKTVKSPVKTSVKLAVPQKSGKPDAVVSAPAPMSASARLAAPIVRAGRPSSRLAQLTVPSMAQAVASTAAKASYSQTMSPILIAPPLPSTVKKDPKLANNWKSKHAEQLTDAELMAMPDSEYMNESQMAAFRFKLIRLKQDILSSAGATTEHLREDTVVVPDPADRATIEEEHALELRTRDRERKLLKKIEQSIDRIDGGDYGYCDETGEPIGVGRLIARPTATLSLEAQQRRELKQKMFGD